MTTETGKGAAPIAIDSEAMRERYREERDRRLRADGADQYIRIGCEPERFGHFQDDPFAPGPIEREAIAFIRRFVEDDKPIAAICHGPWTLIDAGGFPGLVRVPSAPGVRGDLVEIHAARVDTLDEYEGVAEGVYVREKMDFAGGPDGRVIEAETYLFVLKPEQAPLPVVGEEWPV